MLDAEEQPQQVREVMDVQAATEQMGVRVFRGRLRHRAATPSMKTQARLL